MKSDVGNPSKLSLPTCRAVYEWARSGTPLPHAARQEIRALARRCGSADPLAPELREVSPLRYVELWCPWLPPSGHPRSFQLSLPLRRFE